MSNSDCSNCAPVLNDCSVEEITTNILQDYKLTQKFSDKIPRSLSEIEQTFDFGLQQLNHHRSKLNHQLSSENSEENKASIYKKIQDVDNKMVARLAQKEEAIAKYEAQKEEILRFLAQIIDQIELKNKISVRNVEAHKKKANGAFTVNKTAGEATEENTNSFQTKKAPDEKAVCARYGWHLSQLQRIVRDIKDEKVPISTGFRIKEQMLETSSHLADSPRFYEDDFYSRFCEDALTQETAAEEKEKILDEEYDAFAESMKQIPLSSNSDAYEAKNPCETPEFFPQTCYHKRTIEEFSKLDVETFFFIFYFQQGTREQMLAAKVLKKNSWRFHKYFLTWFQRSKEPDVTEEFMEKGSYIYFDYDSSWCYRNKEDFTFDYKFLENEL